MVRKVHEKAWLFFTSTDDCQPAFAERSCAQDDNVYHGNQATAALEGLPFGLNWEYGRTPLWLDMPGATTITPSGEQSVPVRTTGHEKNRFTVCLSAMADGRKLKPDVVFKGKRQIPELQKAPGVVVALSSIGWMNEDLTKDWLRQCWGTLNFGRQLLVWDAYKSHLTDSVRNVANKSTNSDMAIIPGGLTGHIQPADVCWNKPFKEAHKELSGEWTEELHTSWKYLCSL